MGGGGSTQQTNQVSTVQLPPWFNDAAQQNYAFAQQVANRPLQQYQGATVADLSPQTQQAWQMAQGVGGAGADQYNAATTGLLSSLGGGASPTVTPGMLANTNLDPYMNPFTNDVIKNSLNSLEAQRQQSIMGNADTAVKAGAFGGSRQGITDAVTNAQSAIGAGNLAAQLNQQNFTQAQAGATGDLQRMLAAAQGNQQAAATQGSQNLQALGQLTNLGNIATTNATNQVGLLSNIGQQQQQYAQSQIDANVNKFNQAQDYPTQQLNILLSALGMTPHGSTTTSEGQTQTQQQPNIAQGILGGLQSVMGLMGGGAASDESLKTDKQKIGTDPTTGLPVHAFRYKGDPKSYPKSVGFMAQDVEKKFPSAVAKVGGKKIIRAPLAPALAPHAARVGALSKLPTRRAAGMGMLG